MPSAATVAAEQAQMNQTLSGWPEPIVTSFSNALVSTLQEQAILIESLPPANVAMTSTDRRHIAQSFLTAGFVYRTYTSTAFAPFVQVVLELRNPDGAPVYRKLYVVTDRPYNLFMHSLSPTTQYLLPDLSLLKTEPTPALDALKSLAAQLGRKFGATLAE